MNTTSFMDKKIMDLSQGSSSPQTKDFVDLMSHNNNTLHSYHQNHHQVDEEEDEEGDDRRLGHGGNGISNKDEILASYDFQPIRPLAGTASSAQPASFDLGASSRAWNSGESKPKNASPIRNYSSMDSLEPGKFVQEKDQSAIDSSIIAEIDKTMKKHADNLMHALEGVSARLTQLETRTRHLESSVDDLKGSVGNNYGTADGKMRQLENILREVQSGIQAMKDKQGSVDAQLLQLAKLQLSKPDHHHNQESQTQNVDPVPTTVASAPLQPHQIPPPVSHAPQVQQQQQQQQQHTSFPPPNAPLQPVSPVQLPTQYPPPQTHYHHPGPGQTHEPPSQQYPMPSGQQPQPPHQQIPPGPPPLPHQQFQPTPPPPPPQFSQPPPELSYVPPQTYPPPSSGPQQFYPGPPPNAYDRPASGFPSGPPNEPFHYNFGTKLPQQHQMSSSSPNSGGGYPQIPAARTLPHALPAAGGGGSGGASRVPVDDVIDKVTTMGFPRDLVRATVRKLTENGQSVDLNIVLDKLMNDGDGQQPRGGWPFAR